MEALIHRIRRLLAGSAPSDPDKEAPLAGLPPELHATYRRHFPAQVVPAAVLIALVRRPEGLTVLLTERAAGLKHHGGQISLPGGRLEPDDTDIATAALRETEEEVGLERRFIEVIGYLPDHLVISGYRVTPVVALVEPGFDLRLDPREVVGAFEMPLAHLLAPAHHGLRKRTLGEAVFNVYDIPYGGHRVWGATAGILMSLYCLLEEGAP